ncbi:MAG: hypothetical protein N3D18_08760 [Roseococcus sp.]|nr:hypothetical protein [Roseococcus sp.]
MSENALDKLPFDPAWLAIGVAGAVLVGTGLSMMRSEAPPAPPPMAAAPAAPAQPAAPAPTQAPVAAPAPGVPAEVVAALQSRLEAAERAAAQRQSELAALTQRLSAAEARTERLAALEALRGRLEAGAPLAPALARLGAEAPPALARFRDAGAPTEAALRLAFEAALREARARAAEARPPGLGSLFTIRRGDQVLWGDAAEATLERARRALEAGDLASALAQLRELPEAHRAAFAAWTSEAEALIAARAALRALWGG